MDMQPPVDIELIGVLDRQCEAHWLPRGPEGQDVAVLVLHIRPRALQAPCPPLRIEQICPSLSMVHARKAARRYAAGRTVTVQTSLSTLRATLTAAHIHMDSHASDSQQPDELQH